ncbi:MAG: response regulator transcription factor [Gammaproteobacteria bacterium]|nr:response regulator transcription factor [Gammaproteobacteria bacterium]
MNGGKKDKMDHNNPLLIAEDNPRDQEFLRTNLRDFNAELILFDNGMDLLESLSNFNQPHILSDIQMPKLNGIAMATEVWQRAPLARIVFWSQYEDEIYIRSLSKIIPAETVYGYILKSNPAKTLLKALAQVFHEEQCWIDPKLRPVQARTGQSRDLISDAEFDVLLDIALGLTDNLIAQRRFLSRRGVQSRLKSLYQKLGIERITLKNGCETLNPRSRAVSVALQRGLLNPFELQQAETQFALWMEKHG